MEELPNEGKCGLEEFEQGRTSSRRNSSGPNSKSKDIISKSGNLGGGRGYYNPDPLYRLIGPANETELKVEGIKVKALIDSGAQISAISRSMAQTLGLPIQKLEALLDIEGSAGTDVPYLGYTELRLDIPEIAKFDHDVLMMVYPDSKYSHRVPIVIGTLHIDEVLDLATYDELASLSRGWKRGIVG